MSKGNYPLMRPDGQPWTPTSPALDHPLRNVPRWVLMAGRRLVEGQALTRSETAKLAAWRGSQGQGQAELWPDDHATLKRRWFEVQ